MGDRDGECTDVASPPAAACMRDISHRYRKIMALRSEAQRAARPSRGPFAAFIWWSALLASAAAAAAAPGEGPPTCKVSHKQRRYHTNNNAPARLPPPPPPPLPHPSPPNHSPPPQPAAPTAHPPTPEQNCTVGAAEAKARLAARIEAGLVPRGRSTAAAAAAVDGGAAHATAEVLVTLVGEVRGDPHLWTTLHDNVLVPLRAHLGLFCGASCDAYGPLRDAATYVWTRREPQRAAGTSTGTGTGTGTGTLSWDGLIGERGETAAAAMRIARASPVDMAVQAWGLTRGAAAVASSGGGDKEKVDGGNEGPMSVRRGSGAATLETRQQLLEALRSSGASKRYPYFVVTRPDFYFLCAHPPPASLLRRPAPFEDNR